MTCADTFSHSDAEGLSARHNTADDNTPKPGSPAIQSVRTIPAVEARRQLREPHQISTFTLTEWGDVTILEDAGRR